MGDEESAPVIDKLTTLFLDFSVLSVLAFGGMSSVLPELHRRVIGLHGWMDERTFADLYALGYALPGPNVLVVTLMGAHVAGAAGALVATFAIILPALILAGTVAHVWHRLRDSPWRRWIQNGLLSVTVGLTLAGGLLLTRAAAHEWSGYVITAVTVTIVSFSRLNPLWLIGAGAALGLLGIL